MKSRTFYQPQHGDSALVHFPDCRYLKRNSSSLKQLTMKPTLIYSGSYRFCQYCSPVAAKYRSERKEIADYAQKHNQKLTLERGILYITNGYSSWIVLPTDTPSRFCLYHKSTMNNPGDKTLIEGYHLQRHTVSSIIAVLSYIEEHDLQRKQINAQKRAEKEHLQELTETAFSSYVKKKGKRKAQGGHFTQKERQVITADTSDWEAFRALFKSNAAE